MEAVCRRGFVGDFVAGGGVAGGAARARGDACAPAGWGWGRGWAEVALVVWAGLGVMGLVRRGLVERGLYGEEVEGFRCRRSVVTAR